MPGTLGASRFCRLLGNLDGAAALIRLELPPMMHLHVVWVSRRRKPPPDYREPGAGIWIKHIINGKRWAGRQLGGLRDSLLKQHSSSKPTEAAFIFLGEQSNEPGC
jgi:hypothetical protein